MQPIWVTVNLLTIKKYDSHIKLKGYPQETLRWSVNMVWHSVYQSA